MADNNEYNCSPCKCQKVEAALLSLRAVRKWAVKDTPTARVRLQGGGGHWVCGHESGQ